MREKTLLKIALIITKKVSKLVKAGYIKKKKNKDVYKYKQ